MIRLAFLVGLLSACAAPPEPVRSELPALPEAWASHGLGGDVSPGPWWVGLDPSLQGLVEEALSNNKDLVAASSRLRGALAYADAQGASLVPTVELGLGARRSQQNYIGLPIPGQGSEVLSTTFSSFESSLGSSWEVDLWDRLGSSARAAGEDARAAAGDLAAARQSIAAATCRAWVLVIEGRDQEGLAKRMAVAWGETEDVVERRFQAGLAQAFDLALVRASSASARANLASAGQVHGEARRQLELLLGRYPSGELLPAGIGELELPVIPAGVPVELLGRRPDLRAARSRYEAARERAGAARAELWPRLTLTADAGRTSGGLDDLLDGDYSVWGLAARVAAPIYDGGRRRAGIAGANAACEEAAASLASAILTAAAEVERALSDGVALGELAAHLDASRGEASVAMGLAMDRYRAGLLDVSVLLESVRGNLQAESRHLAARRELAVSRINLHLALGGGFNDKL